MTKEQAELLDEMLDFLLQRAKANQNARTFADEMQLVIKVDRKQIESYWEIFLSRTTFHELPIVDYISHPGNNSIRVNANTRPFVENGGFMKYFEEEKQKEVLNEKRKQLEEQKLLNDIDSFKITKNQYRWNKWIAITGFILGLVSFLWQIFKNA